MFFPKVFYKYLGKGSIAGEYSDYGAMTGRLGIRPYITINLCVMYHHSIDIPWTLFHEFIHFINRPLPQWLERIIDISLDVTFGKHSNDMVFELYKIFDKEEEKEVDIISSN
jgi:hypothetical protein